MVGMKIRLSQARRLDGNTTKKKKRWGVANKKKRKSNGALKEKNSEAAPLDGGRSKQKGWGWENREGSRCKIGLAGRGSIDAVYPHSGKALKGKPLKGGGKKGRKE